MATKIFVRSKLVLLLVLVILLVMRCTSEYLNADRGGSSVASCEGCHTNYAHLFAVHTPDTSEGVGGCGGGAIVIEPYKRVYLGGDGYEAYKTSSHYLVGCTSCHNGTDNTKDKLEAHSGDFIAKPSMYYEDKCGTCHGTITDNFQTSLHQGTGQKRKVTMRSGLSGPADFDQLPAHQIEGYNNNCSHCHGTCGNCHVSRPAIGGGGLANGHNFKKTPDMHTVCVTCHVSRGGHAYLGVASGTEADVHLTQMGYKCTVCHSGDELHGDGVEVEQRYAYDKLPECKDCHEGLETENSYHSKHYDDFNCQVCHSQDYNNCGSCHVHGEGARVPSYMDFKIAVNPIPDIKTGFEFVLVRRTLAAPDNWKEYGVEEYANFDAFPTYNYTSPHNIVAETSRTDVPDGQNCWVNCHIRNEGGDTINKKLYLFQDDLLEWEQSATEGITVDGKLPASWFVK